MREYYFDVKEEEAFEDVQNYFCAKYNACQSCGAASSSTKVGGRNEFDVSVQVIFVWR
jgi:hypothetical protein